MTVDKTVLTIPVIFSLCAASVPASDIHDAVRAGDVSRVEAVLRNDPYLVNAENRKGRTPLHLAAYSGHKDMVELLLAKGARRTVKDRHGRRPIDAAALRGHEDVVDLLIEEQVVRLSGNVYRITFSYSTQTNTGVSVGQDGVLVVDPGYADVAERLNSVVDRLGAGRPKYVINTHMHASHIGGNAVVGEGAIIINHDNVRDRVSEGVLLPGKEPLTGRSGRRFDTYYSMRFNGEEVRLIHAPGGHTARDLIVHFTNSGVALMSDLVDSQSFPPCGSSVKRYLEILDTALDVFPPDTIFVAGHGRDCTMEDVKAYRTMLLDTIAVIKEHMRAGKSAEQMREEDILKDWELWGEFIPNLNTDYWITVVHDSLASGSNEESP